MITQRDYDDRDGASAAAQSEDDASNEEQEPSHSGEPLQIAVESDAHGDAGDEDDEEFAEEDAWLVAGHFLDDDDEGEHDPERYVPQLMDAREMRRLRSRLKKSAQQIETCGRLREFTPRKPVASPESRSCRRKSPSRHQAAEPHHAAVTPLHCVDNNNSSSSSSSSANGTAQLAMEPTRTFLTAAPSIAALLSPRARQQKQDFALVLRRELRQLRELELRYDETKRMLLEQMDVICSLKPSEWSGGPETYEKLAELMAFVQLYQAPAQES